LKICQLSSENCKINPSVKNFKLLHNLNGIAKWLFSFKFWPAKKKRKLTIMQRIFERNTNIHKTKFSSFQVSNNKLLNLLIRKLLFFLCWHVQNLTKSVYWNLISFKKAKIWNFSIIIINPIIVNSFKKGLTYLLVWTAFFFIKKFIVF